MALPRNSGFLDEGLIRFDPVLHDVDCSGLQSNLIV